MSSKNHLHIVHPSPERDFGESTDRDFDHQGTYPGSIESDFIGAADTSDTSRDPRRRHPAAHKGPRTTNSQWRDYYKPIKTDEDPEVYVKPSDEFVAEIMSGVDRLRRIPQAQSEPDQPRKVIGARANREYWDRNDAR